MSPKLLGAYQHEKKGNEEGVHLYFVRSLELTAIAPCRQKTPDPFIVVSEIVESAMPVALDTAVCETPLASIK